MVVLHASFRVLVSKVSTPFTQVFRLPIQIFGQKSSSFTKECLTLSRCGPILRRLEIHPITKLRMKTLQTLRSKFAAFTLIELLVVISIIAVLAALALPAITGTLVKGKITQQVSNFRQLYMASHSAYMDGQVAGTNIGFPAYYNSINDWATNLAPAYIPSTNSFFQLLQVNNSNSIVYKVSESDSSNNIMITAGLDSGTTNVSSGLPYNGKGLQSSLRKVRQSVFLEQIPLWSAPHLMAYLYRIPSFSSLSRLAREKLKRGRWPPLFCLSTSRHPFVDIGYSPMALKSTSKKSRKSKSAGKSVSAERGPVMNGAEILVAALEREGVEYIFAYPGGCSMPLHQALTKSKTIRTILPRHEQGGGFAAEGYARVTGRAGVCMATSGPGATNLVTCIADAYMDSVPLVAITGQVPRR